MQILSYLMFFISIASYAKEVVGYLIYNLLT